MDFHFSSSSILDPLCPQINDLPDFIPNLTQLQVVEGDQIIPTFDQTNDLHYGDVLHQIPSLVEGPKKNTNHIIIGQPKKRSLGTSLKNQDSNPFYITATPDGSPCTENLRDDPNYDDKENGKSSSGGNENKKKQKMLHKEVERQRRLEMSTLHKSLKSLLPLEYTKGKRSISDHLAETVKYINEMQRKMQVLIDRRDGLRKEVSTFKGQKQEHEVIVNVFKGCFEVIVNTNCEDGDQGLPLSKVLQCLAHEGLDVVNSISKRVNDKFVHSIHAQVCINIEECLQHKATSRGILIFSSLNDKIKRPQVEAFWSLHLGGNLSFSGEKTKTPLLVTLCCKRAINPIIPHQYYR